MSSYDEAITEDAPRAMVIAYFDGDMPVFRPAPALPAAGDGAIEEEELCAPGFSYATAIDRNIAYEIEDDEPVYRSLPSHAGGSASSADARLPAPPGLCRQRGFGQPELCDLR